MAAPIDRDGIAEGLRALGLRSGHQVLVHSSLSSLGHVNGGATTVVQALLDVVGAEGTVLVPTLTGDENVGPHAVVTFDVASTPGWTGAVSERLRTWEGAVRSRHPTHSVAALGAGAHRLTAGHEDCLTPCGPGSPYARLADEEDGVILLLGCDHESNTTWHHVEELAGVDYHLQTTPVHADIRDGGWRGSRDYWMHRYGTAREFGAIEPLLQQRGHQVEGHIGTSFARLMSAGGAVSTGLLALTAAPHFFVSAGDEH
jgi:aminoglycoside 3-N-acetyltransferase